MPSIGISCASVSAHHVIAGIALDGIALNSALAAYPSPEFPDQHSERKGIHNTLK